MPPETCKSIEPLLGLSQSSALVMIPDISISCGSIIVNSGGNAALLGRHVKNSGIVKAKLGKIALGAGASVTLNFKNNWGAPHLNNNWGPPSSTLRFRRQGL